MIRLAIAARLRARTCLLLSLAVSGSVSSCGAEQRDRPTAPASRAAAAHERVSRLARWQFVFDLPGRRLPPDQVSVRAQVTTPSGKSYEIGGFALGEQFAVRFTPREAGEHRYRVQADGGFGSTQIAEGAFEALASNGTGFVRVDPEYHEQLLRDDGTRIFLLGENRFNVYDPSWNYERKSIEDYVAYMAQHGENALRLFVFNDCEGEEQAGRRQPGCLEPEIGRFDPEVAADFDRILEAAERHGVYVILTLFAVGFTPRDVWKGWEDNPYSTARGGPFATPAEFFTRPEAQAFAERRLRYALNRYGYSTALLAIDLLNEPEWDGQVSEETWRPWAENLARVWRAEDPYGHLLTVGSVGLHWNIEGDERAWYGSPENDIVQWHLYGKETYEPHALAREITRKIDETRGFDKPIVLGEFGYGGEDKATHDHTHAGIWSATFGGAGVLAHSAPVFEVDSDQPMTPDRAAHFRVLRELLLRLEPGRGLRALPPELSRSATPDLLVLALGDAERRALWLMGPEKNYGEPVENVALELSNMPCAHQHVEWWNDSDGALVARAEIGGAELVAEPGSSRCKVTLRVPTFVRHLVGRVGLTPSTQPPTSRRGLP